MRRLHSWNTAVSPFRTRWGRLGAVNSWYVCRGSPAPPRKKQSTGKRLSTVSRTCSTLNRQVTPRHGTRALREAAAIVQPTGTPMGALRWSDEPLRPRPASDLAFDHHQLSQNIGRNVKHRKLEIAIFRCQSKQLARVGRRSLMYYVGLVVTPSARPLLARSSYNDYTVPGGMTTRPKGRACVRF